MLTYQPGIVNPPQRFRYPSGAKVEELTVIIPEERAEAVRKSDIPPPNRIAPIKGAWCCCWKLRYPAFRVDALKGQPLIYAADTCAILAVRVGGWPDYSPPDAAFAHPRARILSSIGYTLDDIHLHPAVHIPGLPGPTRIAAQRYLDGVVVDDADLVEEVERGRDTPSLLRALCRAGGFSENDPIGALALAHLVASFSPWKHTARAIEDAARRLEELRAVWRARRERGEHTAAFRDRQAEKGRKSALARAIRKEAAAPIPTPREARKADMTAAFKSGRSCAAIAQARGISASTVRRDVQPSLYIRARHELARRLHYIGKSIQEIATRTDYTPRWVRELVRRAGTNAHRIMSARRTRSLARIRSRARAGGFSADQPTVTPSFQILRL